MVLALLGLLCVLALSFARVTALEGRASASRVEEVRARLLAEAGVERALSEIRLASRRPWDGPDVAWFYRGSDGLPSGHGVALRDASRPSLAAPGTAWGRAYSGSPAGTWEPLGDTYVLSIVDAASKIDLGAEIDPRRTDSDQPLVRMLANLAWAIDRSAPPITSTEAVAIVAYRKTLPGGRFTSVRDLLDVPGGPIDPSEFGRVEDFLTVHAWVDPTTIAPMDPGLVPAAGDLVHGRVPTGSPRRQPRAPVDVNTAPVPVLVAVLADVSALSVDESIERGPPGGPEWHARGRAARTRPVSREQAEALARSIVAARDARPFRSRADLDEWLAGEVALGTLDALQAAALRANADPNTDTHRSNPDEPLFRVVDKFDLVAPTTEFSFSSGGVFEIESLGRVTAGGGTILAEAHVRTVVEVFSQIRHSSQAQFEQGSFTTYRLEEPILFQPPLAITTEEDLTLQGNAQVVGAGGSVHANRDLDLIGRVRIAGDATATGDYDAGRQTEVGGQGAGDTAPVPIPSLNPATFRGSADVVFAADGKVFDADGRLLADGSYLGFDYSRGNWSWQSGAQPSGVLYFEGNLSVNSRTSTTWSATLIATGSITIEGALRLAPATGMGISLLAGTDIRILGTPGSKVAGVVYAGEQIDLGGNTQYAGSFMAKGSGSLSRLVTANDVHGDVVIDYSGYDVPAVIGYAVSDLPAGRTFPEARATASIDGTRYVLSSICDYDGWISLAPLTTLRSLVGGEPYRNRMIARWEDGTLDAEGGGGSLGMALDQAGPVVAPVAGPLLCGHLLADGVYSEFDAVGGFSAEGNVGPLAGTIAFWVKPSWDAAATGRSHHLLSMSRRDDAGTQSFQFAHVGDWTESWSRTTGFHFERSSIETEAAQRLVHSTWMPPAHRWTHVVLAYDLTADAPDRAIRVYVDGEEFPGAVREFTETYALSPEEILRSVITAGDNLLRLGERAGSDYVLPGSSPEATIDDLLCRSEPVDRAWAAAVHATGRYYSSGRATYDSPALSFVPVGSELLHAAWTVRTPSGGPSPAPSLELEVGGTVVASSADPAGMPIGRVAGGEVRYRIVLLGGPWNDALFASPTVDDVTIAFTKGPRTFTWETLE